LIRKNVPDAVFVRRSVRKRLSCKNCKMIKTDLLWFKKGTGKSVFCSMFICRFTKEGALKLTV